MSLDALFENHEPRFIVACQESSFATFITWVNERLRVIFNSLIIRCSNHNVSSRGSSPTPGARWAITLEKSYLAGLGDHSVSNGLNDEGQVPLFQDESFTNQVVSISMVGHMQTDKLPNNKKQLIDIGWG